MSSKLKVGLIGYGYWGPNYARVFSESPDSTVTAICDGQPERLARATARFPEIALCGDVEELLRRSDVDAVIVSTPASTHFELARRALSSGRHVLVEKPLATEVEHCEQLAELAEKQQRVLMVAHTFLYNAGIRKLHECVKADGFGHVHYMHSTRTNLGPIRHDVNAIWDLAPHDISIFNYLLGQQPLWASAIGSRVLRNEREDVGFITLGYPDSVLANIHVSWADPNKVREVVVVGSGQRIVFDDMDDLERVRIFEKGISVGETDAESFGEFKLLIRDGDIVSPRIPFSEPLRNQIADFIESVSKGRKPLSDAATGTSVVQTLKAIDASIREQGRAVEVDKCRVASRSN
ncbi:MAG: Gfo/Idh/MocA family oxidoreductase [Candidatus Acidiferrales bacterium]